MGKTDQGISGSVRRRKRLSVHDDVSTQHMLNELKAAPDLDSYVEHNKDSFYSWPLSEHFDMLLKKYGVNKSEAIERADIERSYGYQILRGARDAKRDKYIRMAIGIGLDLEDTQRLLTVAKQGVLYPKVLRDAALIFCINGKCGLMTTQTLLHDHGLEVLG
jgi:hypothetical protein